MDCERLTRAFRKELCEKARRAVEEGRPARLPDIGVVCKRVYGCLGLEDDCGVLGDPEGRSPEWGDSVGVVRWVRWWSACAARCLLLLLGLPREPKYLSRAGEVALRGDRAVLTLYWLCRGRV